MSIGPGSIVAAAGPHPFTQLVQAAAQYPEEVQQRKLNALQLQLGQQTLQNQQQALKNAQQQYDFNAKDMAQKQVDMIGQYALKNPSWAANPPPQVVRLLQQAGPLLGMDFLTQSGQINTDLWKTSVASFTPEQIQALHAMPQNERAEVMANVTGDPAVIKSILDAPVTPTPEQQIAIAKAQSLINEQNSAAQKNNVETYATLHELPYKIQADKARVTESLSNAQSAAVRAQAAAQNAATAARRLSMDLGKITTQGEQTLYRQHIEQAQSAIYKYKSAEAGALNALKALAVQYGVNPNSPNLVNDLMQQATNNKSSTNDPTTYTKLMGAIQTLSAARSGVEQAQNQIDEANIYLATNPGYAGQMRPFSGAGVKVENIGTPKKTALPPGSTLAGQMKDGRKVYKTPDNRYVYADGSPAQ